MSESVTEMQLKIWEAFHDYLKADAEAFTSGGGNESIFSNSTQSLNNISSENYKLNENKPLRSDAFNVPKVYNATVFDTYPTEILWFGAVFLTLFSILGTTGNLISILALVRCKKLRNATTAFIVNLCVSDMLFCSFTIPLTAVTFIDRDWKHGDALCKLFAMFKFINCYVSLFTAVAIAVNRYVLIVHPNKYAMAYSRRNTAICIACLWILPVFFISFPLFNVWGTLTYNPLVGDCAVYNLNGKSPRLLVFAMIIIMPSVFFIACYLKIYFVVKKAMEGIRNHSESFQKPQYRKTSEDNEQVTKNINNCEKSVSVRVEVQEKKEFRVLRIVLVIFILYIVTMFPVSLVKLLSLEAMFPLLNILAFVFFFTSNVANPIVYVVMSEEYRMAYKALFASNTCCN